MDRIRPHDPFRWTFLNEEHWVHVVCGKSTVTNGRHLVRVHRSLGPIFTCHHYPWMELATLGVLQDSVQPGCPGLALLWACEINFRWMKISDAHADRVTRLEVAYYHGNFQRTLWIEGDPMGIFFLQRLLKERLHSHGQI